MSNQHIGALSEAILAGVKRPAGLRTSGVPGYDTLQVGHMVNKLCKRGEVFTAKLSHKVAVYFDTAEKAQAFERENKIYRNPGKKQKAFVESIAVGRSIEAQRAAFRQSNQSGYVVTEADEAKITRHVTPPNMGNRAYVDPASMPRLFRDIPLGALVTP